MSNILFFSAILLGVTLLVYCFRKRLNVRLNFFILFAVGVGFMVLSIKLFLPPCFGASSPITVSAKNQSKQLVKIYTISFWENYGNGAGSFTQHVASLHPDQFTTFCLDNDGGRFWIVAKNSQGRIEFLEDVSTPDSRYEFTIEANRNIPTEKLSKAKILLDAYDNTMMWESVLVWVNVVLTTMLFYRLLFRKK